MENFENENSKESNQEVEILKKYFRSRHYSFMKTLSDNVKIEKFRENIYLFQNEVNLKTLIKGRLFKSRLSQHNASKQALGSQNPMNENKEKEQIKVFNKNKDLYKVPNSIGSLYNNNKGKPKTAEVNGLNSDLSRFSKLNSNLKIQLNDNIHSNNNYTITDVYTKKNFSVEKIKNITKGNKQDAIENAKMLRNKLQPNLKNANMMNTNVNMNININTTEDENNKINKKSNSVSVFRNKTSQSKTKKKPSERSNSNNSNLLVKKNHENFGNVKIIKANVSNEEDKHYNIAVINTQEEESKENFQNKVLKYKNLDLGLVNNIIPSEGKEHENDLIHNFNHGLIDIAEAEQQLLQDEKQNSSNNADEKLILVDNERQKISNKNPIGSNVSANKNTNYFTDEVADICYKNSENTKENEKEINKNKIIININFDNNNKRKKMLGSKKLESIANNSNNRLLTRHDLNSKNRKNSQNYKTDFNTQNAQTALSSNKLVQEETVNLSSLNNKKFIVIGGYPAIREALIKRNFSDLKDQESLDFDVKWTLKIKDINYDILKPQQIINHFKNNVQLTKKSGLTKNLKNLIFKNIDIDNFYPRCYDISERNDFEDFMEDFKITKVISLLKEYSEGSRTDKLISYQKIFNCLEIIERKLNEWNNPFLKRKLITDKEWSIISEEDTVSYRKELERLEKMNKIGFSSISRKSNNLSSEINGSTANVIIEQLNVYSNHEKSEEQNNCNNYSNNTQTNKYANKTPAEIKALVDEMLKQLKEIFPQYTINGKKNIWIMKPSGLSRGRGIKCVSGLNEILLFIKKNSNQYMVQKYIENPLLILGRKFDIRQWVLVTDFDPLTVWIWNKPYVRFGAEDYNIEDINNLFSHLTNNSIAKYSKNFYDEKIEGNMWDIEAFADYLQKIYKRDVWNDTLKEKIKKIVFASLDCVKHLVVNRKNSHEIFGYDIMIDAELNCWLIEVNSSPAMDYSTNITERLVKGMSEDLVKVVIDYNLNQDETDKSKISTGDFLLTQLDGLDNPFVANPELPH